MQNSDWERVRNLLNRKCKVITRKEPETYVENAT